MWNKYERRSAQARKPARDAAKSITVDMHAHVAVPRAGEIATPHLDAPLFARSFLDAGNQGDHGQAGNDISEASADDVRFKTMDQMGVDMQLSRRTPQLYYTVPIDIGVQATAR